MITAAENLSAFAPSNPLPTGTIDTHMHVFEDRYPSAALRPAVASLAQYRRLQQRLGIQRMVVVQSNAYRFDNTCLEATLMAAGKQARGVAVVPATVSTHEIERLHRLGVRGARIMDFGGGAVGTDQLHSVMDRIADFGWHAIVQFNGRELPEKLDSLMTVSGRYVIDHTGKFIDPVTPDCAAFRALLSLIDRGNCYVKLSACYETSLTGAPLYDDVGWLSRALVAHAPDRLMWASNWPHVSASPDAYPDDAAIADLLFDWAHDAAVRQKILVDTPADLYEFPAI